MLLLAAFVPRWTRAHRRAARTLVWRTSGDLCSIPHRLPTERERAKARLKGENLGAASRFCADERGLASVEYVIILSLVAIGAGFAVVHLGPVLYESFCWQTGVLGLPFP